MKKALVISGGGSKGAYAGGIIQHLLEKNNKYDLYVSSSTGTLIQLILATQGIEKVKTSYTTVKNQDIWKICPFRVLENNNGKIKMELNWWNIFINICPKLKINLTKKIPYIKFEKISGSVSFGNANNLLKLIKNTITRKDYIYFKDETNMELVVTVVNATTREIEYKSSNEWGYDDFCEWTFASCSAYPFMSPVIKNTYQYIDGGILDATPIQEAINRGGTDIDVIILNPLEQKFNAEYIRNPFHGILKSLDMIYTELNRSELQINKLKNTSNEDEILLNIYYIPSQLTNNSLIFNEDIMIKWWNNGYEYAKNNKPIKYKLIKKRKPKLI